MIETGNGTAVLEARLRQEVNHVLVGLPSGRRGGWAYFFKAIFILLLFFAGYLSFLYIPQVNNLFYYFFSVLLLSFSLFLISV